jgi:outer membrane protein OmpA-like peptidoglycan-associated protein/tetratricopeptide (TPR) repeat protein
MNKRINCYLSILFTICSLQLIGQPSVTINKFNKSIFKQAEIQFNSKRYSYAIPLYYTYLERTKWKDSSAINHLAISYKLINNYDSALITYEKLLLSNDNQLIELAELYANKKEYNKAITLYNKILANTTDIFLKKRIQNRINGFENLHTLLRDSLDFTIRYLPINTLAGEFSPTIYKNGLVFVSNSARTKFLTKESGWDANPYFKLYYTPDSSLNKSVELPINDTTFIKKRSNKITIDYTPITSNDNNTFLRGQHIKNPISKTIIQSFDAGINKSLNNGPISINANNDIIYYTVNQLKYNKTSQLEIAEAKYQNGIWKKATSKIKSNTNYGSFHPSINKSGTRLYFSSDREGGFGGSDIYYVEKTSDSTWSDAINAGSTINTSGNELFPYENNDTLYFSSNGHKGLGGLDIYYIEINKINAAVNNIGYPINSSYDDFGIAIDNTSQKGYFSTNRLGSDDIFQFNKLEVFIQLFGNIKFSNDNTIGDNIKLLLYDVRTNELIDSTISDAKGNYSIKVKPNRNYELRLNNEKNPTLSGNINTANKNYNQNIQLLGQSKKQVADSVLLIERNVKAIYTIRQKQIKDSLDKQNQLDQFNVYYKLNSSIISKENKITLDALIVKMKQNSFLNAVIGSFTDCSGSIPYNMKLSAERSAAVIHYLVLNGISKARIKESHFGKNYLVEICHQNKYNHIKQQINRRTELFLSESNTKKWIDIHFDSTKKHILFSTLNSINKIKDTLVKTISKAIIKKDTVVKAITKPIIDSVKTKSVIKKDTLVKATPKPIINKDSIAKQQMVLKKIKETQIEDSITRKEILAALEELSKLKREQERIVEYLTKRINKKPIEIYTNADSVTVELYDSGIHDNDSVSVIYNSHLVVDKQELQVNKPIKFNLKLDKTKKYNELVLVAENLGTLPPNTAVMIITDQFNKRQEVFLTADLSHNEVVYFIKIINPK